MRTNKQKKKSNIVLVSAQNMSNEKKKKELAEKFVKSAEVSDENPFSGMNKVKEKLTDQKSLVPNSLNKIKVKFRKITSESFPDVYFTNKLKPTTQDDELFKSDILRKLIRLKDQLVNSEEIPWDVEERERLMNKRTKKELTSPKVNRNKQLFTKIGLGQRVDDIDKAPIKSQYGSKHNSVRVYYIFDGDIVDIVLMDPHHLVADKEYRKKYNMYKHCKKCIGNL
ncbi:hypothetical protein A4S06_10835 [Erysipelotrichaceae bacterium MTC7]|nr:hypothetical protein A4S06_10835 [Erysipelotrichaceae bacterium MTC7]